MSSSVDNRFMESISQCDLNIWVTLYFKVSLLQCNYAFKY